VHVVHLTSLTLLQVEYRLYLRDLARAELRSSGAMCAYGFGAKSRYMGAGSYGVTYERALEPAHRPRGTTLATANTHANGSATDPSGTGGSATDPSGTGGSAKLFAVVKLAAVEAEDGKLIAKRLAEGDDASVESYFYAAMTHIVAATNMPHISLGYGTWACPDILKPPMPLLFPNLSCKKMKSETAKSVT
jgi:hypothetical protein